MLLVTRGKVAVKFYMLILFDKDYKNLWVCKDHIKNNNKNIDYRLGPTWLGLKFVSFPHGFHQRTNNVMFMTYCAKSSAVNIGYVIANPNV